MKKTILSFILIILFNSFAFSQEILGGLEKIPLRTGELKEGEVWFPPIDKSIVRCQYKQRIALKKDTLTNKVLGEENIMLLQIGKQISKYADLKYFLSDSIAWIDYVENKIDQTSFFNKHLKIKSEANRRFIYKNHPLNKITNTEHMAFNNYKFEEELKAPEWTITSDTLTVLDYLCNKATCHFQGRNYIAWYASEIPISNGPWKFTGLPGLILQAYDDKQEVVFDCISLEKVDWNDKIYMSDATYTKTTLKKFLKMQAEYMENMAAFIYGHELAPTDLPSTASRKRPYNPIELDVE